MSTRATQLNPFGLLVGIILFVSAFVLAGQVDAVKASQSGRFVAKGSQDGIRVTDTKRKVTITKYGHPLGFTTPGIWTNDSMLVLSTSCCEASWWFVTYWPSGNTAYLQPKNGDASSFDRVVRSFISSSSTDSLYHFLQEYAYETVFNSDSLMLGTRNEKLNR